MLPLAATDTPFRAFDHAAIDQALQNAGRRFDAETGLYYYRARYYSPTLGRFLQTDPIGYDDQMNMYAYVMNDPMNFTDPSGMAKCGDNLQHSSQCEAALNAADEARNLASTAAGKVKDLADALGAGRELTQEQQDLADSIGKAFGSGFAKNAKDLAGLSDRLSGIADTIGARGEGVTLEFGENKKTLIRTPSGAKYGRASAYVTTRNPNSIYLNDGFLDGSVRSQPGTLIHEAAHLNGAMHRSGVEYYGFGQIANGLKAGDTMWNNADSYACVAVPMKCR